MKYTENPTVDYRLNSKMESEDRADLIAFLEEVPADTPVTWYSHKDECAHPGVWLRRGMYRLKHGSFVDPSDLSCYAAQYYEPFSSGRHECLQIGRSPLPSQVPEDAIATATAQSLIEAIKALAPLPAAEDDEVSACENDLDVGEIPAQAQPNEEDGSAGNATPDDTDAPAQAQAETPLKLLQPDYAFEFHGALTRGWHAQHYVAYDNEGVVTDSLVVLR